MTRTEHIRQLLTKGSYSVADIRRIVKKPKGGMWSTAAIESSLRALPTVKDDNLYTILPPEPGRRVAYLREKIRCPECGHEQTATDLFNRVHDCEECGYTIMDSEWNTVKDEEQ